MGYLREIQNVLTQSRAGKGRFEITDQPVDRRSPVDAFRDLTRAPRGFTIPRVKQDPGRLDLLVLQPELPQLSSVHPSSCGADQLSPPTSRKTMRPLDGDRIDHSTSNLD